jgi:O-antigen/teichoic acid export membrane protein
MLTSEITGPIGRALYPNYAKMADSPDELAETYRNVLAAVASLTIPLGAALCLFATDVVRIILGDQWLDAVVFVQWLSIAGPVFGLIHIMSGNILIVLGKERRAMLLMWMRLAVLIPVVAVTANVWGIHAVPPALLLSGLALLPIIAHFLTKSVRITWRQIGASLFRPGLAAVVMATAVIGLRQFTDTMSFLGLLIELCTGVFVYASSVFSLWLLAGRPKSIETAIIRYIVTKYRAKSNAA